MLAILVIAASLAVGFQPHPESSDREYRRGVELQKRGDLAGARKAYEAALAVSPRRVDALSNLALVYGRSGNYDLAVKTFQRALAVEPGQVVVRFNLGLTYIQAQ